MTGLARLNLLNDGWRDPTLCSAGTSTERLNAYPGVGAGYSAWNKGSDSILMQLAQKLTLASQQETMSCSNPSDRRLWPLAA